MTELQTNESLLRALKRAASRPLSANERHRQRVSFIMGSLPPERTITRDQVESILAQQESTKEPA